MTEQNNQVVSELKWLDPKEPNPSLLNVRELRGRSINEESHTHSIRQPPPGQIHVHSVVQNPKIDSNCLPPPMNQSTPASVSTNSPQSSSDLDTDQGEMIDKTIKQVVQSVNQILLKTTTANAIGNSTLSDTSHDKTPDKQSAYSLNQSNGHKQTTTSPKHTHRPHSPKNGITCPVANFKQTKQIIMDVDALSHFPTLCNKILQELNLNDLCLYNNTHQAFSFKIQTK